MYNTGDNHHCLFTVVAFLLDTLIHLLDGKRITTDSIAALCEALNCQPGDLLEYVPDTEATERDTE